MNPVVYRNSIFCCWVVFGLALLLFYYFLSLPSGINTFSADTGFIKSVLIHASSMGDILFSIGFFVFLYLFFRERVDLSSFAYAVLFTQLTIQLIKNGTDAGGWILFQERLHPGFEQCLFISSYAAHTGVLLGWLFFQCRSLWCRAGFLLLFMGSLLSRYILLSPEPISLCVGGFVGIFIVSLSQYACQLGNFRDAFSPSFDKTGSESKVGQAITA